MMRFVCCLMLFCSLTLMVSVVGGSGAQQEGDLERLRANVLALDQVQRNVGREIAGGRAAGTLSLQERNELLLLIGYLQERNREYCRRIEQQSGPEAVMDLPCPADRKTLPEKKSRTLEEELTALDRSLAESLGAFDEMLLKEQERLAGRRPRAHESGNAGGGAGSEGGPGLAGTQGDHSGGTAGSGVSGELSASGQGRAPTSGTAAVGRPGQAGGRIGGPVPAGGDRLSVDDDIVARQLREAAEKETDPKLKEKLWQEYRKYRKGL